jgi:hypothetical protein
MSSSRNHIGPAEGGVERLFVVLHNPPETGKVKVIGVYSSEPSAGAAVQRARVLPGFVDQSDSFMVHQYAVDEDHWTRGFVRI